VPLFPEAMLLHHLDNLDSKMECMRALAEKDRHIEGVWTGYSPTLERSILKKAKFLEDASVRQTAPLPENAPVREAAPVPSMSPEPVTPPAVPAPSVAEHPQHGASSSPFAAKLQQAWRKDS
jgi:3'-5' exoribonuclease